ncbi:MAG: AI-2E family transporter [Bacteroidota bacterium]
MKNVNRYIVVFVVIALIGGVVWYFSALVSYIAIAWVLSLLGEPLMTLFQKIKINRFKVGPAFAAILTLITYVIFVVAMFALFVPLIIRQASNLANVDYEALSQGLERPLSQIEAGLIERGLVRPDGEGTLFQSVQEEFFQTFAPTQIAEIFSSLIGLTGNLLIGVFSVIFITFFFLKEKGLFLNFLLMVTPLKYESEVNAVVDRTTRLLTRYFGGILIQITIITLYISVILGFLNVPSALLIAFFAALINVIPYLGPLIGAFFGVFIAISSNLNAEFYTEMVPLIIKVLIVFATMQLMDNMILQPFIYSTSVMAHPLEIFLVIMVGAQLGGIIGMVLAIPVYTVGRVIAKEFLSEFKVVQKLTQSIKDPPSKE